MKLKLVRGLLLLLLILLVNSNDAQAAASKSPVTPPPPDLQQVGTSSGIGNIIPWDLGKTFDNLQYQFVYFLATQVYLPHSILLTVAYYLDRASQILTGGLLPLALTVIATMLAETNIFVTVGTIAVLLFGLSLILSFLNWRPVELSKILWYLLLAVLFLAQGPEFMTLIERTRRDIAGAVYERTYASVYSGGEWGNLFGGVGAPAEWATFQIQDYHAPGYNVQDVALSALIVGQGEESSGALSSGLAGRFFPYPNGIANLSEGQRSEALNRAKDGIARILLIYPLSVIAVIEAFMELTFSVAGFFLMLAIPLALVMSFFAPTEGIFLNLVQKYVTLLLNYVVISALISIGVAGMISAAVNGSLIFAIAGAVFACMFYAFGVSMGWQSARSSAFALSGTMATTLGVKDPVMSGLDAANTAVGAGVGLVGAAAAVAAGMPMLAPAAFNIGGEMKPFGALTSDERASVDYHPGWETAKGLIRTGLGVAGGEMLRGSPMSGLATGFSMMSGMSDSVGGMLRETPASDAVMVGLTTNAANPAALAIALDRTSQRRERLQRRYGDRDHRDRDAAAPPARRATTSAPEPAVELATQIPQPNTSQSIGYVSDPVSPWRAVVDEGIRNHGDAWANKVAQALRETVTSLRGQGVPSEQIPQQFVNETGQPDIRTRGGREVFDRLDLDAKQVLRDPTAQAALAGIVGETVMPRVQVSREDLIHAVAQAVEDGATQGAEAVAQKLGSTGSALGSSYGAVNAIVARAQSMGVSAADTEMLLRTGMVPAQHATTPGIEQLGAMSAMLPNSLTVLHAAIPVMEQPQIPPLLADADAETPVQRALNNLYERRRKG